MAKILFLILMLIPVVTGADYRKIGFRAYSTAEGTSCAVIGGAWGNSAQKQTVNSFNPNVTTARVLSLGTKGFANYSAQALGNKEVMIRCYTTSAPNTPFVAKVFFDSVESKFFPTSSLLLYVQE